MCRGKKLLLWYFWVIARLIPVASFSFGNSSFDGFSVIVLPWKHLFYIVRSELMRLLSWFFDGRLFFIVQSASSWEYNICWWIYTKQYKYQMKRLQNAFSLIFRCRIEGQIITRMEKDSINFSPLLENIPLEKNELVQPYMKFLF